MEDVYIIRLAYQYSSEIRSLMLSLEESNSNLFWLEKNLEIKVDKEMGVKVIEDTK